MKGNGRRLAGAVWIALQAAEGVFIMCIPLLPPVVEEQLNPVPGAYGAILLLIGASCLIPAVLESWREDNQLLSWATGAAIFFGFIGAGATLASLSLDWLLLWAALNPYAFGLALAFVLAHRFLFRFIQRKVYEKSIKSTVSPRSELTTKVSYYRMDA